MGVALRAPSCSDVVAVLDSNGGIYKRIWCGFELFFAQVAMPHRFGRTLNVALVNEHGVVSHGDGTSKDVTNMIQIVDSVRISQAQASVYADKVMILNAIEHDGSSTEELDKILQNLAHAAV